MSLFGDQGKGGIMEIRFWMTVAGVLFGAACALAQTASQDIHVAVNGNDAWSGKLAEPNADKSDGPLATLGAAVEAARKSPGVARRIVLGPGRYYVEQTVILSDRDSELTIEGAGDEKTIIYGGRRIANWQKDGDRFWAADVPEVKEGKPPSREATAARQSLGGGGWDFRALVVNDRLCLRSRLPETGRFEHETRFPVRWMSSAGGGWERKPTEKELTTMQYRAGDLGPWLSVRNAEVTVYHMWDESMAGVAANDPNTRTLTFSTPSKSPPGAFAVNTYVVWNVREGMKQPGQWYLDRDAGKVVYWPLPGEDMSKAHVVAPRVETIIELKGQKSKPLRHITLRSLTLSATTTPCKAGGFGAVGYRGALQSAWGEGIRIQDVEITNTAGHAIQEWGTRDLLVENCHLHHLGAGGCRAGEGTGRIENNRIHHIGMIYPSAIGLMAGGKAGGYTIRRNEIHHTPYSGICIGGVDLVVEENLLYRCMQEMHDGAAIYGGPQRAVIRRNVVRDIVESGKGYGVSSYYLDEKARDCVVEKNFSIGVVRPCHFHMTLNCTLRDNVFVYDGEMALSFARSAGVKVTGNIMQSNGNVKLNDPDAVAEWAGNLIVQSGDATPAISDAMPAPPATARNTPRSADATLLAKPPVLDGKLEGDEWPPGGVGLGDLPDQRRARGAPLMAKLCADATHLYIAVTVVSMYPEERKLGHEWGKDEGVEIAAQGKRPDGQLVTYVLRGFTSGTFDSLTVGGATEDEAKAFAQATGYAAAVDKQVWRCEWSIPFQALRFTLANRAVLPLNVTVYRSENNQFIQWAGTLGETWDLKRGGRLVFRDAKADATPRPKPVARAPRVPQAPTGGEWPGEALSVKETPHAIPVEGQPCLAKVCHDDGNLYVLLTAPVSDPSKLVRSDDWGKGDCAEVCFQDVSGATPGPVFVIHGFLTGKCESVPLGGAPAEAAARLGAAARFTAKADDKGWTGEWTIPLAAAGITPRPGLKLAFNVAVHRTETGEWLCWVGTMGPAYKLDSAGYLALE
jgi:hypothetical protein